MAIQNSNLPSPSFVNEVVKIVEDETIFRSNLKSVSDVYSWIEGYGRTSDTKWNLRSSRPSGTRLVCCFKNYKQDTNVSLLMRCAEERRQIRLSNQSPPKLQWCSARVQNAYMRPG
ncbi:hypothetical protein AVEN_61855-1 [Araneus ventricosus]|uniref:Uncharacterized protein n=1 Tax=Araneus ventricosus TaxID=182803 RepID=A0A4Y2KV46_ARAVE|nr:hypothetical protein AVEN_61855-1 [Araneus ventricosus]